MKRVVTFSGGIASWVAARRVVENAGQGDVRLLFADTLSEDPDSYRFLVEAAADVVSPAQPVAPLVDLARSLPPWHDAARREERRAGLANLRALAGATLPTLVWLCDGRDPWEVIAHERHLGRGKDPCSKKLKRELMDRWFRETCDPADTVRVYGLDWTEGDRIGRLRERLSGWVVETPLEDRPLVTKHAMLAAAIARGLTPPRLYGEGFAHGNCSGFCVKAGHGHFAHLLAVRPDAFAFHERKEEEMRVLVGTSASIMSDRRGGMRRPLTMREFRERMQSRTSGPLPFDMDEFGGCGCAVDADDSEADAMGGVA